MRRRVTPLCIFCTYLTLAPSQIQVPAMGPKQKSSHCWELFHLMVRAKGRPRIRFADPHRLRPPAGGLASSLKTLRVFLTLAPSQVQVPAMSPKQKSSHYWELFHSMVRAKGLEPSWGCPHTDLNRTRLPIPPRPRAGIRITEHHSERKNYF